MLGPNWLNGVASLTFADAISYNANGSMTLRERRKTDPFAASHRIEEYSWDPFGLVKRFRVREESVQGAITAGCEADATNAPISEWMYRFNPLSEREQKRQTLTASDVGYDGLAWTYSQIGIDKKPLTVFHGLQGTFCGEPPTTISLWPVERNIYGPRGVRIIQRPAGGLEYVVSDHLGSTKAVVSDMGQILERKDYRPFGGVLNTAGDGARTGYIDREEDGETGLGSYGVRLYEPEYGRFTSVDALWGLYASVQPFQYSLNSPSGLLDGGGQWVRAVGYDAKQAVINSVPVEFQSSIKFGEDCTLDIAAVKAAADGQDVNSNIAILSRLAENPNTIMVMTHEEQYTYKDRTDGNNKGDGFSHGPAITLPSRSMADRVGISTDPEKHGTNKASTSGMIEVHIKERRSEISMGRLAAHELFGHVSLLLQSLSGKNPDKQAGVHKYDPNGVDANQQLQARITRAMDEAGSIITPDSK